MANFYDAVQWMKEGKKVRRSSYPDKDFYIYGDSTIIRMRNHDHYSAGIPSIQATDWEIYEEKVECLSDMEIYAPSVKTLGKTHEESLVFPKDAVKEAIRKLREDLGEARDIAVKNYPGNYTDHNPKNWTNPIDGLDFAMKKIFERFGGKLI